MKNETFSYHNLIKVFSDLRIITIQVKHNSSGILNAGVSVKKHTVETATHTMKTVTGIHVLRLHADMPHFKISTIRLVNVTVISHASAI